MIGLTTAVVLAERGRRVRVWTREPAERTTSVVAGGLWWPYRIEPVALAQAWALRSLDVYEELAARPEQTGVRMLEGVLGETGLDEVDGWAAARLPGLRAASAAEYAGAGLWARLPLIDMSTHLPWLRERLLAAGGTVEDRAVTDLAEADAPVVVNCTGLGARDLVPDPAVRPVRGQLVVVENPGIDNWLVSADADSGETTYFRSRGGCCWAGRPRRTPGRPTRTRRSRRPSCDGARPCVPRSPGRRCSPTWWGCGRPGTRSGWSAGRCRTGGCWCTTTVTAARASPWPGVARRRRPGSPPDARVPVGRPLGGQSLWCLPIGSPSTSVPGPGPIRISNSPSYCL